MSALYGTGFHGQYVLQVIVRICKRLWSHADESILSAYVAFMVGQYDK
jgi:hypothetical protein